MDHPVMALTNIYNVLEIKNKILVVIQTSYCCTQIKNYY